MKPLQGFIILAVILVAAVYWLWLSPQQEPGISLIADQPLPLPTEQLAPAQDKVLLEQVVTDDIEQPTAQTGDDMTQEAVAPVLKAALTYAQMPIELREMILAYFTAYRQGNYDFAALIALDAIEISDDYPKIKIVMHVGAGQCYEKLRFIEMAIEQYQLALVIDPKHQQSHKALRRLDPEFAASHPELPKPVRKKTITRPPAATTTNGQ